jgi:hypothetical protein
MADGLSQNTIDDCVGDTLHMLDALKGLHRRDASPFRTMSGADGDGVEPTKALAAKVRKTLSELEPNSSIPTPPL